MSQKVKIYCSDSSCKYNSGCGYYGACRRPGVEDLVPYAGIDRYYQSTCKAREPREEIQGDPPMDHPDYIEINIPEKPNSCISDLLYMMLKSRREFKARRDDCIKILDEQLNKTWTTLQEKESIKRICSLVIFIMTMSVANLTSDEKTLSINEINHKFVELEMFYQLKPVAPGSMSIALFPDTDKSNDATMDRWLRTQAVSDYKDIPPTWNSDKFMFEFFSKVKELYADNELVNYVLRGEESFVNRFKTFCDACNFHYRLRCYDGIHYYLHMD